MDEKQPNSLLKGQTALLKSRAVMDLLPQQANHLWKKLKPHTAIDTHGKPDPEGYCWILTEPEKKTVYTRKHSGVKSRRGPYNPSQGYSLTGGYGQTTYSKKDHGKLKLSGEFFPTIRTFQATHISLVNDGRRPPDTNWQLYNASHLCGHSRCIRPEHLVWEMMDVNFSRRMCHVYGAYEACPHDPRCLHRAPFGVFKKP